MTVRFPAVFCASFVAATLGVFHSAAGEPSAPTNATSTSTNARNDFEVLAKRGDQARLEGDQIAAIKAYRDALALREDTLIKGRLGLLLFELREFPFAAQYLQQAVERPTKAVSDAEYAKFSRAFKAVQAEVCRVEVAVDRRGTRLEVDGEFVQEGKGEFFFFIAPGKHKLRVSLDGFENELREVDAPKGDQLFLEFVMRPSTRPPSESEENPSPERVVHPNEKKPVEVPKDKPPAKTNIKATGQFVIGGGVALMLGATPKPAFGPQVFGAWRPHSRWEVGLDARVGWMVVEDERFPGVRFVAWSAGITPCVRVRLRFFGCGLLQMEGVARDDGTRSSSLPGVGLRAGVELPIAKSLHLQLWGDVLVRARGFRYTQDELEGSFFTGTFGARATYSF